MNDTKKVVARIEEKIAKLQEKLNDFAADIKKNPFHALEWADSVVEAAAEWSVLTRIHRALTKEDSKATLETLREYATTQVVNGAKYPQRSTSVCSDLVHQRETAAWAEALDPLNGILSRH